MKPGNTNEGYEDQEPFKAEAETDVAKDVFIGRWLYDVAPMQH
jgi:hypothetical protein